MKYVLLPNSVKEGFRTLLKPVINIFVRKKISPNVFTTLSIFICLFSAYEFGKGSYRLGALLFLLGGLCDMFDGAVARSSNRVTKFGALYDSTMDRYAEFIVFFGMGVYFIKRFLAGYEFGFFVAMTVFVAIFGSLMVSYVRARAEGLGFECKVGLLQRPERVILICLGAFISEVTLILAIFIIAIMANLTAIQRLFYIWQLENPSKFKTEDAKVKEEEFALKNVK
ncbi:MAG TPA: CDP-alcohol phosphatidyltransferase family protein [bacterium]|nr:CDP-alcohol phosphatidyltransferase family protein [bacterium]HPN45178.1 CDP-alcohol phosphatidyltransferase family protein [bacterium]